MANELKNALDQIKTDVGVLTNVQRAMLGQTLDALSDATGSKCVACIYMLNGGPLNDTFASTSERHSVHLRFYWLLNPSYVEQVEQNMATMWDVVMTQFFGSDADRNLSEKASVALIGGIDGGQPYVCGYEEVSGKLHRIMDIPVELELHTHSI